LIFTFFLPDPFFALYACVGFNRLQSAGKHYHGGPRLGQRHGA